MRALVVVAMQPLVQIGLQRVDAVIELLAERDLIELLQDRLVEPLTDAVGLGRFHDAPPPFQFAEEGAASDYIETRAC